MATASKLRRLVARQAYPGLARLYRSRRRKPLAVSLLRFLGIADPQFRSDFYTLARIVDELPSPKGLIAECGVYRGSTLLGMAHRLKSREDGGYHLIGFDSFEGFPEPSHEDALSNGSFHAQALKGVFADTSYEELRAKVKALGFEREVTLVKGYFENTLPSWSDRTFSVVHMDCDLFPSYVTCLNFFYPRVRRGGIIVFDEYDFSAQVYPGAQKAIDSFLAGKPEKIRSFHEASNPRHFIVKQ